jgi:hypothetical protein
MHLAKLRHRQKVREALYIGFQNGHQMS